MTKKEKDRAAHMTREEIETTLRELCIATVRLDEATARMNEELANCRAAYEVEISAHVAIADAAHDVLRAWADANPGAFVDKKSIAMVHGVLGYRTGQPSLKTVRGLTWDRVIALLKATDLSAYVRTSETVDKEGLLADRETIGLENLKTIGVLVEQAERFYVEPNKDEVRAAAV